MRRPKTVTRRPHIVAMGGGGFSMEPENTLLDDFVLSLVPHRRKPRVAFVGTASGDADTYIERFMKAFPKRRAFAANLSLFKRDGKDLRATVLAQDVVYVGGGNTANLLVVWRLHGLDRILREAWRKGIVLCGVSAGALCWFECGTTDSFSPRLSPLHDGTGFLEGSFSPHYDGERRRRPLHRKAVATGKLPAGYAADDGAALHFVGRRLLEVVASRPKARGYRLERRGGRAVETALPTRYLGNAPCAPRTQR